MSGYTFSMNARITPRNGSPEIWELHKTTYFSVVSGRAIVLTRVDLQYELVSEEQEDINRVRRDLVLGLRVVIKPEWDPVDVDEHFAKTAKVLNRLLDPNVKVELSLNGASGPYREVQITEGMKLVPYGGRTIAGLHLVGPTMVSKELIDAIPENGSVW